MLNPRGYLLRHPALSSVVSMSFSSAVAAGAAFVVNVLSARALGPSLRGEVAFVLQLSYFVAPLISLSADRVILRQRFDLGEASRHEPAAVPGRRAHATSTLTLTIILVAFLQDWRAVAAAIAGVNAWFVIRRADALKAISLSNYVYPFLCYQLSVVVGSIILFHFRWHDAWAWAAVYALPLPWLLTSKSSRFPQSGLRKVRASVRLIIANQAQIFWLRGDRLIMPLWVNNSELGVYVVVATASEPMYWVSQALADYRLGHQGRGQGLRGRLLRLARELIVIVPLVAVMMLTIAHLLVPIFGTDFVSGQRLAIPLGLAAVTLFMHRQVCGWILAGGEPNNVAKVELGTVAAALVLYPILISRYGSLGAAWASAGICIVGVACGVVLLRRTDA